MQAHKQKLPKKAALLGLAFLMAVSLPLIGAGRAVDASRVSRLQTEIDKLEATVRRNENNQNKWAQQSDTLANKIRILNGRIDTTNDRIRLLNLKIEDLQDQINQKQKELDYQKALLAENLRTLYKKGNITTIELLAVSENFTDYINEQEYLSRIKISIQESADKIEGLKKELEDEQAKQKSLRADQVNQRKALEESKQEKAELLAYTKGEETRYAQLASANRRKLARAEAQLISAIAATQGNTVFGGSGGYPWAGAGGGGWSFGACYGPDPWGMCQRQCVSYTAWKVHQDYLLGKVRHDMPYWGGQGNASEWPGDAERAGIPTGTTPKVGAVAINPYVACDGNFCFGHSMYVEAILGGGRILVSQYNAQATGLYSRAEVSTAGLTFIYFQDW